ncbi:hypothetical protein [Archangium violaceum]|uniref:hypothetical protein n=1 Tax=Archangium violaceum TaxID=83451 RepID=UPI0036DDFB9C
MPQLWQIAAGEPARDYRELFLEHDLMLIGPGTPGSATDPNVSAVYQGAGIMSAIQSFAMDPQPGDPVLMRLGHEVVASGIIPEQGGYSWEKSYDDVLGWDLQHARRVQWQPELLDEFPELRTVFATRKQQPTFTRVHVVADSRVKQLASRFIARELKSLPTVGDVLTREQLGIELFASGVANDVVDRLINVLEQVKRLSAWYKGKHAGDRPTEHEVVAHILVPLLRSLGWSEQLLGVEWNRVDVAVFDRTPTTKDNCVAVFEAKSLGQPLASAFAQARAYVERMYLKRCRLIVTADGGRLMVYLRNTDGTWAEQPSGYLNCSAPRAAHLLPKGASSVQTLVGLLPGRLGHW